MPEKVDQSSLISRKLGPKSKLRPQKSRPPRGFGGKFWHGTIGGLGAYLSFEIGDPFLLPIFGDFFQHFHFNPKNLEI